MWLAVAAVCGLQLWILLGLLPALAGGFVAWVWCGLALLTLLTGLLSLRRSPDAGALFLCLVLPVTLIPPFVFGRDALPLLASPWVQALAGTALAGCLVAVVQARRTALARPPRTGDLLPLDQRPRRGARDVRIAALLLTALWLALPARALLDPSLLDASLAEGDPVRAKAVLLLAAWAAVTLLVFGAVVPALAARAPAADPPPDRTPLWTVLGVVLLAAWGGLLWIGA
ncbi:MAG: hypothetical protein JXB32_01470 [Deltaproteobacteria bacterium]|nr:hypothetical protein [Deltaproteobacteria bacterium]